MSMTPRESIFIVDDDRELSEMLATYLVREGFHASSAATLAEAASALASSHPDLLVLDVMLPDGNGLDFCKRIRASDSSLPILMLTARGDPMDRILGLELGADDYLGKPFDPRELLARIRALLRRARVEPLKDKSTITLGRLAIDLLQRTARIDDREIALTTIEFKLLAALAKQPQQAVDRDTLADAVQPGNYRPLPRAWTFK